MKRKEGASLKSRYKIDGFDSRAVKGKPRKPSLGREKCPRRSKPECEEGGSTYEGLCILLNTRKGTKHRPVWVNTPYIVYSLKYSRRPRKRTPSRREKAVRNWRLAAY